MESIVAISLKEASWMWFSKTFCWY